MFKVNTKDIDMTPVALKNFEYVNVGWDASLTKRMI